jgi:hypothetical protein
MKSYRKKFCICFAVLVFTMTARSVVAQTIYVDARTGDDKNPGTNNSPVKTMGRAAELVNSGIEPSPTTVKVAPGIYSLSESVEFNSKRSYTETERLVIEATVLPDEPQWAPALMPIILSVEDPRRQENLGELTETYGLKIGISHVTIRGLKFMGNPSPRNWHCCISRIGDNLDDLLVTQCMFAGDQNVMDIYCAALATGDRFVVDHCVFFNCHACTVFWDGPRGVAGKGCSMRYCIVDGAYIAGVWTCQTAEDFEFHHNVVTRSEYFWMRKGTDGSRKYRVLDCIVTDNKNYSGYGVESGPTGLAGDEVTYDERNVVKQGTVFLETDRKAGNYLHPAAGSLGSDLGAGLFRKRLLQN